MERSSGALTGQRRQIGSMPLSPLLLRSRSGSSSPSITTPGSSSRRYSSSQRFVNGGRSKSTSKFRTKDNEENTNFPATTTASRKFQDSRDSKRATSVTKSPSAWALSPGRSLGSPLMGSPAEPAAKVKGRGGSSGVSKVLKYFNRKKLSPVEEDYHRFRILHNRLMQWTFVNARAMAAMASSKRVAEIRIFSVWLRILILRNAVMQMRTEAQKLKHCMKLYQIVNPQVLLLNEWAKLERRNQEFVSKLVRKLSALSNRLPLINVLKADVKSLYQAMSTAVEVMENIEQVITQYQTQVEKILYQVTELTATSKQEQEYLQELLATIFMIATLMENEKTVAVHLIQRSMELKNGRHPRIGQSCIKYEY